MDYISICKWEKHQHYKDRRPKWIKLEIDIIEEFDADGIPKKFYDLPDSAKLTFICLLCLRANYNNKIPYKSEKWLATRLGIATIDLKPLVSSGYINIDTETVSEPYQNRIKKLENGTPELETEREKEKEVGASAPPLELTKEDLSESSIPLINEELRKLTAKLYTEKTFPDAPKFKNQMLKQGKNPRAILHAFIRCDIKKPAPAEAWGYCMQIMKVEDGNYNERDQTKTA